jgi:hypothetical protein
MIYKTCEVYYCQKLLLQLEKKTFKKAFFEIKTPRCNLKYQVLYIFVFLVKFSIDWYIERQRLYFSKKKLKNKIVFGRSIFDPPGAGPPGAVREGCFQPFRIVSSRNQKKKFCLHL